VPGLPPPGRRRRRGGVAAALACIVVAAVVPVWFLGFDHAPPGLRAVPRDSLGEIDAGSGAIIGSVRIGPVPGAVSARAGMIWAGDDGDRTLLEVDPRALHVVARFRLPTDPYGVQATADAAWVANSFDGTITRVDRVTGAISRPQRPESSSEGHLALGYGAGSLWSASQDGLVVRLDPSSGRLQARLGRAFGPQAIAVGFGSVWVAQSGQAKLVRVAESGAATRPIPIGGRAYSIATGAGAVWALTPENGELWRIDPSNDAVTAEIDVCPTPVAVVVADDSVWVACATDNTIARVNPHRNIIVQRIRAAGPIGGLAATGNRVLVSVG
jgi:streptogramin lyase